MTQIRCHACTHWFDKTLKRCPECRTPKRALNVHLESARWASALNAKALHADRHT